MEPKFSVIIPTYNRSATLGRAIQSVLAQTLPAWEIIVIDDGSSDDTCEMLEAFPQVIYHHQANAGVCAARNKGAEIATGDWLIFLDSDDELLPQALSIFSKEIKLNPEFSFFKCGFTLHNSAGDFVENIPINGSYTAPIPGSFFLKRSLFLKSEGYNTSINYSENTELFLRLSSVGIEPHILEFSSMIYHESDSGGSRNLKNMDQSIDLILNLHSHSLNSIDNWNLYQTLGVIQLRRGRFTEARTTLRKAISYRPKQLSTYLRLLISFLPFVSRRVYRSDSFVS